jgi:hypothetical protein
LQSSIKISLAAFVDASKLQSEQSVVVLKIDDYYLVYNRRKGYNNETGELPNMVTIVQSLQTEESELVVGLNETIGSSIYRYTNNASQVVTIQACHRYVGNATTADHFVVAIGIDDFPCKSNENSISKRTTIAPSRMPIIRSTTAPSRRFRSQHPTVVIHPSIAAPGPDKIEKSSTPTIGEVYSVPSSHPSTRTPTPTSTTTSQIFSRSTLTPTNAPRSSVVPTAVIPSDVSVPVPIIINSVINYTQSPFPPIHRGDQRPSDVTTVVKKHYTSIITTILAIGVVLIASVVILVRAKKRRIAAYHQSVLPMKT